MNQTIFTLFTYRTVTQVKTEQPFPDNLTKSLDVLPTFDNVNEVATVKTDHHFNAVSCKYTDVQ